MLKTHFAAIEDSILAKAKIQSAAGHSIHKGTPRELFIREFLEKHSSETVSFGTGEIIDSLSTPADKRNQLDIVIYKKEYPKLDFTGGISAFLAESVVAAIEVKSDLDEKAFNEAYEVAIRCKKLKRTFFRGLTMWYDPPAIQNYIIAYDGPAQMKTVHNWIRKADQRLGVSYPDMPPNRQERVNIPSPSIDGVFILGKGFLHFDNFLISNISDTDRASRPAAKWLFGNTKSHNLFTFFLNLTQSMTTQNQKVVDIMSYLENVQLEISEYSLGD